MIFEISKDFCKNNNQEIVAEILANIATNHHYIIANDDVRSMMEDVIENHGGTKDKKYWKVFKDYSGYRPSNLIKTHLRHFKVDRQFDIVKLLYLSSEPGHVFLENKNYEWPAYIIIAETYKRDPDFKDIFKFLHDRMRSEHIVGDHCGGRDQIIPTLENKELEKSRTDWLREYKSLLLFDRDTDDDTCFSGYNKTLFEYCCGKDHINVTAKEIYSLEQPKISWHSWYRRSIENYFDRKCYEDCEVNMSNAPEAPEKYFYFKISDKNDNKKGIKACKGFNKSKLEEYASKINRDRLEKGLKKFNTRFGEVSELQLFLLKLVKLV